MRESALIFLVMCGFSAELQCQAQTTTGNLASDPHREIVFEQRLNASVSMNTRLSDEHGAPVHLRDLFHRKPVVLTMGYYQCPMLCGVVLNAFVQSLQEFSPRSPTRDFDFVFISVDPTEGNELALAKKQIYMRRYGLPAAASNWHFLTGTREAVQQIADEIGFRFRYDSATKQYVHPSGIVVLTSKGRISSYLLGVEFPPRKLQQAIAVARQQQVGTPAENIWLLCFSRNPASGPLGQLVIYSLRIGAILTLIGLILVIRFYSLRVRERNL